MDCWMFQEFSHYPVYVAPGLIERASTWGNPNSLLYWGP